MNLRFPFLAAVSMLLLGKCLVAQDANYQFTRFSEAGSAFAAQANELERVRGEVAAYRARYANAYAAGPYANSQPPMVEYQLPSISRWTAIGEVLLLQPLAGEDQRNDNLSAAAGWRTSVGWTSANGFGIRGRYFQWQDAALDDGDEETLDEVSVYDIDLELTSDFRIGCSTTGTLSGGIRFLEYNENDDADDPPRSDEQIHASGWGPVLGIEVNHQLHKSISLFALGRGSLIILSGNEGDVDFSSRVTAVSELRLGAQWRRPVGNCLLFARTSLEAQAYSAISDGDSEAVGLFGGAFTLGIQR